MPERLIQPRLGIHKKKLWAKNIYFFASLKSLKKRIGLELDPDPDPDPLVRRIPKHCFQHWRTFRQKRQDAPIPERLIQLRLWICEKKLWEKKIFFGILKVTEEKNRIGVGVDPDPDPLVRGTDPWIPIPERLIQPRLGLEHSLEGLAQVLIHQPVGL